MADPEDIEPGTLGTHASVTGPTLLTERLLLRPMRLEDAGDVAGLNSDPAVMRHLGGPVDAQASNASVAEAVAHWNARRYGRFTALTRDTDRFLGWVSLFHGHPLYPDDTVIAWRFHRAHWGQGLASEAAARVLTFGLADAHLPRVIAIAETQNTPSIRVMTHIGMRHLADRRIGDRQLTIHCAP